MISFPLDARLALDGWNYDLQALLQLTLAALKNVEITNALQNLLSL